MRVVKGVKPVKGEVEGYLLVFTPLMDLTSVKVGRGEQLRFFVDVFFIDKVDVLSRRAALIRAPEEYVETFMLDGRSVMLNPSVDRASEVHRLLHESYEDSKMKVSSLGVTRTGKLSRWSLLKNFGVAVGYSSFLKKDEDRAKEIREAAWAVEILKRVLFLSGRDQAREVVNMMSGGIVWYPLFVNLDGDKPSVLDGGKEGVEVNSVYTKLLELDEGAREALKREIEKSKSLLGV